LRILLVISFSFFLSGAYSQLNANGAYLMGNSVEIGINNNGHEGTFDIAGSNARTTSTYPEVFLGFVANPQLDGWVDYDGDFFTPGSPENGFGIEVNGMNYGNNGSSGFGSLLNEIPGVLSNYTVDGNCLSVQWDGTIAGIGVRVIYRLVTTNLFYTTEVTLTNNTGGNLVDTYYYRNVDPDNNVSINGGIYSTTNTIVAQPIPACEKALVSATQTNPWDSYLGIGGIGPNFRVCYGGFANRDGSDIWNGTAGLTGTVASQGTADEAISLGYKIAALAAGASETFTYVIILDDSQLDQAFSSLLFFDYAGGLGGAVSPCSAIPDTALTCPGLPVNITLNGPSISQYSWVWSPPTGLSTTVGGSVDASPFVTTTYTITGTPIGGCISGAVAMDIVVDVSGGSSAGADNSGLICNDVTSSTILSTYLDPVALPGGTWQETTGSGQFNTGTTVFSGAGLATGNYTFIYVSPASGFCPPDTAFFTIAVSEPIVSAGLDSTMTVCLNSSIITLSTLLQNADLIGVFSETTASGQFDPITTEFDPTGLPAGLYQFEYFVDGCMTDDYSYFDIIIAAQLSVDAGLPQELCIGESILVTATGADTYAWTGGVVDGISFNPTSSQMLYVIGTDAAGCTGNDSVYITVHQLPLPSFVGDVVEGCIPTIVNFANTTPNPFQCLWLVDGVEVYSDCGNFNHEFGAAGYYDITLVAVSAEGCVNAITMDDYIYIEDFPIAQASAVNGTITNLEPVDVSFTNGSTGSTTYTWDFGDGSGLSTDFEPTHSYFSETGIGYIVELVAYSPIGCTDTAWTGVNIKEELIYYIPNSFTPDGDEHNQSFKPIITSGIDVYDYEFIIFNRWGEVIFESHDVDFGWDGTYGNKNVASGAYVWRMEFKAKDNDDRQTHSGHVNILR
jgi:gliding motility-associated-like protein